MPTLLTRQTVPVPADPIQRLLADPPDLPVRDGLAEIVPRSRDRRHRRRPGTARHRQDHAGPARGRCDSSTAGWSSPSPAGSPPGPRPAGWLTCWANRSARPSATPCAATARSARGPGSSSSPPGCSCAGSSATRTCPGCRRWSSTRSTSASWTPTSRSRCWSTCASTCVPTCCSSRCRRPSRPSARPSLAGRRRGGHRARARCTRSTEVWCPLPPGVRRADDRGLTPRFLDHVAACVRRALAEQAGDVLVFLPGVAEVSGVAARLSGRGRRRTPPARPAVAPRAGPRPHPRAYDAGWSSRPRWPSPP